MGENQNVIVDNKKKVVEKLFKDLQLGLALFTLGNISKAQHDVVLIFQSIEIKFEVSNCRQHKKGIGEVEFLDNQSPSRCRESDTLSVETTI